MVSREVKVPEKNFVVAPAEILSSQSDDLISPH